MHNIKYDETAFSAHPDSKYKRQTHFESWRLYSGIILPKIGIVTADLVF